MNNYTIKATGNFAKIASHCGKKLKKKEVQQGVQTMSEEKKLTDEQIVKALEYCENSEGCIGGVCPLYCNGEDADCVRIATDLIHRLQAENERLTDTLNQYINGELINADTMGKIIYLEKQVDELKEERENMQAEIIATEEARLQKEKDTAKEIWEHIVDCFLMRSENKYFFKKWLQERYGVEAE